MGWCVTLRGGVLPAAKISRTLALASLVALLPGVAIGQAVKVARGKSADVPIMSLSVVAAPPLLSFDLAPGSATVANAPLNVATVWTGLNVSTTIRLYGYFTNAKTALIGSSGTASIPTAAVFGQMTTGLPTSYTAFTQTNPLGGAGASLDLFSQPNANQNGVRLDLLNLKIDLTNLRSLPPDTYNGTLILQAEAF